MSARHLCTSSVAVHVGRVVVNWNQFTTTGAIALSTSNSLAGQLFGNSDALQQLAASSFRVLQKQKVKVISVLILDGLKWPLGW